MYFAERLTNLKDYGIDDASDILEYMDGVKNVLASGSNFIDINHALGTLNAGCSRLRTKIIERSSPSKSGPKNLTVVAFDTRASRNRELITAMALDLGADPFSVERTTQLACTRSSGSAKVIIGVTQGNTIKPIPVNLKVSPKNYARLRRGKPESVGGRLRIKINQALQTGRTVQLLKDELRMFRQIGSERRLALSDLGLKLDDQARLKLRTGDSVADIMSMYFNMIGIKEHIPMLRSIAYFARIEPVFITAESQRKDFREWHRTLSEYHYHSDPRILRGLSSAGIVMERTTLIITLPGESQAKPVTGFYFHVPWHSDAGEIEEGGMPELDDVPRALLLALARRSEQLPNDPEVCRYLLLDDTMPYLRENVLGPRGASLDGFKPHLYIHSQFGRPCLITPVRLKYRATNHSSFSYMTHCFQPIKVTALLLKKVRETQNDNRMKRRIDDDDLIRIINDVGLELSNGKINIMHLFPKPDNGRKLRLQTKLQMAANLCHFRTRESEFLNVAQTVLASVLASQANRR